MIKDFSKHRPAVTDRAQPINTILARAIVRPIDHRPVHSGLIRGVLSAIGFAAIIACVVHVAIADPLGRTLYALERAGTEYCGRC